MAEEKEVPETKAPDSATSVPESTAPESALALPELAVTVTEMSTGQKAESRPNHPNTVAFKVQYPKEYPADKKSMKEGDTVFISKEVADKFIKLKIGSIVK